MKKTTFKLELTNPCHENVEGMKANAQGFFCAACQKNVIDFTNKTPYEITQIIAALPDRNNFCGRFFTEQLDETYTLYEGQRSATWKYAAGFAAAMLLAQNVQGQSIQKPPTEQLPTFKDERRIPLILQERTILVKGKVLNKKDLKILPFEVYGDLKMSFLGKTVFIDKETGDFMFEITTTDEVVNLIISTSNNHHSIMPIPLYLKNAKDGLLETTIQIDTEKEFLKRVNRRTHWAGRMGVIFDKNEYKDRA